MGQTGGPGPRLGLRRADALVAAALAAAVFLGNALIEQSLDRLRVLDQYDVLFNTDPNTRLFAIAHGLGDYGVELHPGLGLYYSRPIRAVAKAARRAGVIADTRAAETALRRRLGKLVVPALSGLGMAAVFLTFLARGLGRGRALTMALLCSLAFSQLVFGSLPDHFAVTGFFFAVLSLLAADLARGGKVRWWAWLLAGALATGNTATNVVPVAILFAAPALCAGLPLRRVARDTAVLAAVSVAAFAVMLPLAQKAAHSQGPAAYDKVRNHTKNYLRDWSLAATVATTIPRALMDTFAPAGLVTSEMPEPVRRANFFSSGRADKMFGLDVASRPWLAALAAALTGAGALAFLRRDCPLRGLGVAALGVLAFNLVLHSFWGNEFFVYSQHWLVPLAVILAGNLTWPGRLGRSFSGLYAALVVAVAANNLALWAEIFSTIRAWHA
jgi:hypothetical protein